MITEELYQKIDTFVAGTRDVLFLREEDHLLIIRPNKIQHVNLTAFDMLDALYSRKLKSSAAADEIAGEVQYKQKERTAGYVGDYQYSQRNHERKVQRGDLRDDGSLRTG